MAINVFIAFVYLTYQVWEIIYANYVLTFVLQFHDIPNWKYWPILTLITRKSSLTPQETVENVRVEKIGQLLNSEYDKLGPMSFHEIGVALVFLTTVLLWLFRDPRFIPGWADQIMGAKNGDATAAMIGVLLMFIIPRDLSFITGSKFLQISM